MRFLWVILLAMSGSALAQRNLGGQETQIPQGPSFRVETEVFEGDSTSPASQHLILFDAGVIYDLRLDDNRLATLYDPARGRIVLVDLQHRQQTTLTPSDLLMASAQFRAAIEQEGKEEAFGLNVTVEKLAPSAEDSAVQFEVGFGETRYTATTQTVRNPEIARAYHEFVVLASRLNIIRKQGIPPFARLALGERIAEANRLPLTTVLELKQGLRKQKYRSHLLVVEQLSTKDRERISDLGKVLASCEEVAFGDFQL